MPVVSRTILITALLILGLGFSLFRYLKFKGDKPKKVFLITVRSCWILALLLAFLEPHITVERFESGDKHIPVLVDNSSSMQLFKPDSFIVPFLDSLNKLSSEPGSRKKFDLYLFGDSLREANRGKKVLFTDNKSDFPKTLIPKEIQKAEEVLIISDGNWSNTVKSSAIFSDKSVYYLNLPSFNPRPYLKLNNAAPLTAPVDSPFTVTISLRGFSREGGIAKVELSENGKVVKKTDTPLESGFFNNTIQFSLKNSTPGKHLYQIKTKSEHDSTEASVAFVHQTIPEQLTYSCYSATPSLDRRFLSQTLIRNPQFKEKATSPDLLYIFDWTKDAEQLFQKLPPHGIAVFIGCLPCSTSSIKNPTFSRLHSIQDDALLTADFSSLPPPEEFVRCNRFPAAITDSFLKGTLSDSPSSNSLLFSGRLRNHNSLFLPLKGIWRWDFWPLSLSKAENESFDFTNTLLAVSKKLLLESLSEKFIIYPAHNLSETDSLKFMLTLPSSVPVFEPLNIQLKIKNQISQLDSSLTFTPSGLNNQSISIAAFPKGNYLLSSYFESKGKKYSFNDSFTVAKDDREFSIVSQNSVFLQEFARKIENDFKNVRALFASEGQSVQKRTVKETYRISKSWVLLSFILLLVGIELLLRKKWAMD